MLHVIKTEGAFYKHYIRVRRWFGKYKKPTKRGGLCGPCHTILWGTGFAAAFAPLIAIGWLLAKVHDKMTYGNDATRRLREAPAPNAALIGLVALAAAAVVVFFVGLLGLGIWNFSDVVAWVGGASLTAGWFVFAGLALVGLGLGMTADAVLWAAGWAAENRSWLAGWAAIITTPAAIAAVLSWAFVWFCTNTKLGAALLADPAKNLWKSCKQAAEVRKERRREEAKWQCACGHKNHTWYDCCTACERGRTYGPMVRLYHWFRGRTVAGKMCVMGGGSIAWAFAMGLAKGACPLVEFLSPEERRERTLSAVEEGRAKRAEAIRHRSSDS